MEELFIKFEQIRSKEGGEKGRGGGGDGGFTNMFTLTKEPS